MRGILNLNKPAGITSYDCIRKLKLVLKEISPKDKTKPLRIGHAGTLDPIANGVLLILLGDATKVSRLLFPLRKGYEAEMMFGIQTDTDDITGTTIQTRPLPKVTVEEIAKVLKEKFTGTINQVPPRFSAIKVSGKPLYHLARRGVGVTPRARSVTIWAMKILDWTPPFLRFFAQVSSGTYIRALCRDIGIALGSCGTLTRLVRTSIGNFTLEQAHPLSEILQSGERLQRFLIPVEEGLSHLPKLLISPEQARSLLQGKMLCWEELPLSVFEQKQAVAITPDRTFLALIKIKEGGFLPERVVYAD